MNAQQPNVISYTNLRRMIRDLSRNVNDTRYSAAEREAGKARLAELNDEYRRRGYVG